MQRPIRILCDDWRFELVDGEMHLVPSWRTFRNCLGVTLLAGILLGGLVLAFGFPPGGGRAGAEREARAERAERQREQLRELEASVDALAEATANERFAAELREVQERQRLRQAELAEQRERQAERRALVGAIGTVIYWLVFGLLVLVGVLPPLAVFWERVILRTDRHGTLEVIRRGQLARSLHFPPGTFNTIGIEARRIMHRDRHGVTDRGWRWNVCLLPADPHTQRPLVFFPEWEPTLPPQLNKLTGRMRPLVRFLIEATGAKPGPVIKRDA